MLALKRTRGRAYKHQLRPVAPRGSAGALAMDVQELWTRYTTETFTRLWEHDPYPYCFNSPVRFTIPQIPRDSVGFYAGIFPITRHALVEAQEFVSITTMSLPCFRRVFVLRTGSLGMNASAEAASCFDCTETTFEAHNSLQLKLRIGDWSSACGADRCA